MDQHAEVTAGSQRRRGRVAPRKNPQRSKISNGTALLPGGVDGRSAWVRRAKDIIAAHIADLGGDDNCSTAERSLVRRSSVLEVELERLEVKFAQANAASADDLDLYQRTAGNLRRLLEAVGLQRRAKNVTPTLSDALRRPAP